jgi:predicted amidohydrolase YtcJ
MEMEMEYMSADLLIRGNALFDGIAEKPYPGFVATSGERILAVGRGDGEAYIGARTEVIEGEGGLIMAGFHDSHTHLIMAGMYGICVNLADCKSEEEAALKTYRAAVADADQSGWVCGFGWYHVFWDEKELPNKAVLDRYFPDRPVLLINAEAHGAWVNSKALEIAGITKHTPDPFGGEIQRDENGEPTGFLYENACGLVTKHAFVFSQEQEKRFIKTYMQTAGAYGITSVNDVMPYFHGNIGDLAVYSDLDRSGELTVRIHTAPDLLGDLDEVIEWQDAYTSDRLKIDMVKSFLDGVSTTHTALMLDDYCDAPGNMGKALFDLDAIARAVPEAHRRGLSVKLHSCGDASARLGLDFYENAIRLHGKNACRHAIEHCEIVADEDIPRFGALGIIPSVQPEHLALTQTFAANPYPVTLGKERADRTWPLKRLLDTAGILAIGSDCPVVDPNPFSEIYRAVTRLHDDGEPAGGWNPTEKLSLAEVLKCYTFGSAYAVRREDELGSLASGKFADIVVLSRNPFELSAAELKDGRVDVTVMDGKVVFRR